MIHVGNTGLLSAAGHEHIVTAPIAEESIDDGQPYGGNGANDNGESWIPATTEHVLINLSNGSGKPLSPPG
jgi:hypothetical protein